MAFAEVTYVDWGAEVRVRARSGTEQLFGVAQGAKDELTQTALRRVASANPNSKEVKVCTVRHGGRLGLTFALAGLLANLNSDVSEQMGRMSLLQRIKVVRLALNGCTSNKGPAFGFEGLSVKPGLELKRVTVTGKRWMGAAALYARPRRLKAIANASNIETPQLPTTLAAFKPFDIPAAPTKEEIGSGETGALRVLPLDTQTPLFDAGLKNESTLFEGAPQPDALFLIGVCSSYENATTVQSVAALRRMLTGSYS